MNADLSMDYGLEVWYGLELPSWWYEQEDDWEDRRNVRISRRKPLVIRKTQTP